MLGFTVPLFVLLGVEALLALLLLGPRSIASPALLLCKATRSSVRLAPGGRSLTMITSAEHSSMPGLGASEQHDAPWRPRGGAQAW